MSVEPEEDHTVAPISTSYDDGSSSQPDPPNLAKSHFSGGRPSAETVTSVPDGACSLLIAVRRTQCRLTELVALVRSGSLRWVGRLEGAGGLGSVQINVVEVRSRVRRPELAGLTRCEVEKSLGIPTSTVNLLIGKGFLAATRQHHPSMPRAVIVVAPDEVERFRGRYARGSDLARELGLSMPAVPRVLQARGIEPALSKAAFHATFYERAAIKGLLLPR